MTITHCTIAKMSKIKGNQSKGDKEVDKLLKIYSRKGIPFEAYKDVAEEDAGFISLSNGSLYKNQIMLCRMKGNPSGFYETVGSVPIL